MIWFSDFEIISAQNNDQLYVIIYRLNLGWQVKVRKVDRFKDSLINFMFSWFDIWQTTIFDSYVKSRNYGVFATISIQTIRF